MFKSKITRRGILEAGIVATIGVLGYIAGRAGIDMRELPKATPTPEPTATARPTSTATSIPTATGTPKPEPTATATPKPSPTKSGLLELILAPGVTMSFVQVPADEFTMGSSESDQGAQPEEKSPHKVYLDEYLMGKTEVTVAQFRAFVQASGYQADDRSLRTGKDDHPVTYVSWDDAVAFCRWASQATGRSVRLPTEAEWEKAARGTDGRIYPWGNEPPDSKRCDFNLNVGGTTPVGKYSPTGDSPYGCADMAGNVWEWVNDWYSADYYEKSPSSNPPGPTSGRSRGLRGGSWNTDPIAVCSANRSGITPDSRDVSVGFRCAVSTGI